MTEHTNTPELRFPEFKDEWKLQKLGNLAQFSKGKSLSKKDLNINGKPCILYGELYTKYGAILNKVYSKTSTQNDSLVFSKRNQILIPSSGETDIDIATATAIDTDVKIAIGGDLNIITPINSDGRFISLYINGKGKYNLAKYAQGKSVVHLYNSDIKKLNFYLPTNMAEQKKIGDFFSKLDQQIELEEKRLELLEQQKRGYMQKIFSQGLRFKDEEGNYYKEWDTKQLKDVLEFSNKRTTNENEYPVLTSSRQGLILQSDYYKDGKTFAESNIGYFILPKNYITYRSRSDDGIFKFNLNQIIDVGIISKYYPVFKGINANQYYLTLHLNYRLKKEYIKYATGTSQLVLSQKNLQNIQTKLPSYEEQTKIANFLSELDKLIEKQSDKVELLKDRKKGLLQKMFV
ncbi:restriction endonuclease subunit S [Staphylococcus hominis]|uniref:restriction endonuclease subunit S n=1 Tax=Staphylococcus hominis TaxID=1290 RepID=UPI0008FFE34B|nr:restriction endonuclease subunit S [Staphylococcus hominis]OJH01990.1 restriction endonuclease subunit S [Staphylococcus hominis]